MILGLGTDLVAVSRIRRIHQEHPQRFLERIFTRDERDYCLQATDPAERLAARWAAKEAVMKALGTGWAAGVQFTDIEVFREPTGRPCLRLHAGAARLAAERGVKAMHLSLSHAEGLAVATVILET